MPRFLLNLIFALLPATRCFALRRRLLQAAGVAVGRGTRVCGGLRIYGRGRIRIGDECWIGTNCTIYACAPAGIVIGDRVDVAPEVVFHNGSHHPGDARRRAGDCYAADIAVGDACWLGLGTRLTAGARLGERCVVGAGALLRAGDYPADQVYAGVPARAVRELDV